MDIFDFLRSTIHELLGTPVEDIRPESTPEELHMDPFDVEELMLDVENRFDVYLPESDFDTLEDLAKLVAAA